MQKAPTLVAALFLINLSVKLYSQPIASGRQQGTVTVQDQQIQDSQPSPRTFRPQLSLQDALRIAEHHIDKEHIDISSYWLYRAVFILCGDSKTADKDKQPCWHFWWVNDSGAMGDYVEILVAMDGRAWRVPSM